MRIDVLRHHHHNNSISQIPNPEGGEIARSWVQCLEYDGPHQNPPQWTLGLLDCINVRIPREFLHDRTEQLLRALQSPIRNEAQWDAELLGAGVLILDGFLTVVDGPVEQVVRDIRELWSRGYCAEVIRHFTVKPNTCTAMSRFEFWDQYDVWSDFKTQIHTVFNKMERSRIQTPTIKTALLSLVDGEFLLERDAQLDIALQGLSTMWKGNVWDWFGDRWFRQMDHSVYCNTLQANRLFSPIVLV